MTIYEIKERTKETAPYFFSKDTLRFFGQTMKSFTVEKLSDTEYLITAPVKCSSERYLKQTRRIFNIKTKELEMIKD